MLLFFVGFCRLQVITLEGWSDIMYFVQDAHGLWNWIYFVILIVVSTTLVRNTNDFHVFIGVMITAESLSDNRVDV